MENDLSAFWFNNIDLRGKVVMGDALHTQRPISIQIVEAGGDYI